MRAITLSLVGVLAVSVLATSAQAQAIVAPSTQRDADQLGSSADRFGVFMADQQTKDAQRVHLARKAAKLINAGQCEKAEALTRARNDTAMAQRVVEVCAVSAHS